MTLLEGVMLNACFIAFAFYCLHLHHRVLPEWEDMIWPMVPLTLHHRKMLYKEIVLYKLTYSMKCSLKFEHGGFRFGLLVKFRLYH